MMIFSRNIYKKIYLFGFSVPRRVIFPIEDTSTVIQSFLTHFLVIFKSREKSSSYESINMEDHSKL